MTKKNNKLKDKKMMKKRFLDVNIKRRERGKILSIVNENENLNKLKTQKNTMDV